MRAGAVARVRRATRADLEALAPLFDLYRVFYGRATDLRAARAFLAARLERGESVVLVAELEGGSAGLAGFAQLYPTFSSVSLAPVLVLNDLFVAPPARRRGVARRLVDEAVAYARRSGAIGLELATQHTNGPALALYRSRGFSADVEFTHLSLSLGPTTS